MCCPSAKPEACKIASLFVGQARKSCLKMIFKYLIMGEGSKTNALKSKSCEPAALKGDHICVFKKWRRHDLRQEVLGTTSESPWVW